jgi:hypothetical protein
MLHTVEVLVLKPGLDGTTSLTDEYFTTLAHSSTRPTDLTLCQDSNLLMQLKVKLMKEGRQTTGRFL